MSKLPYRTLQVALRIFSVLLAIGGLFMVFGSRGLVIRVFLHPPEAEISTLFLFLLKEMGGMVLMLSAMLFRASRDPERNLAVVDGRPRDNAFGVASHSGYPAYLSRPPGVGTFRSPAGAGGHPLLFAPQRETLGTCRAFMKNATRYRGR